MDGTVTKLVISIVERDNGEKLVDVTKQAGATGGTIIQGRGTARQQLLQILGLDDTRKDIVFTLLQEPLLAPVLSALETSPVVTRKMRGISMVLNLNLLIRRSMSPAPMLAQEKGAAMSASSHQLISVIVNAGYADDVMAAARKAGARGGTIISARGTGKEEDVKFFGLTLVPEKELLLIVATREESEAILRAISTLPCLTSPGLGISFCMDVERYMSLGGK